MCPGLNESLPGKAAPTAKSVVSRFPAESGYIFPHSFPSGATSERIVYVSIPQSTPDPSEWDKPSTLIAFIALLVSVGVPIYTWFKDRNDKKKSIEDDYWLRQVVGPIAIEPLLKDVIALIGTTPEDAGSGSFSLQTVDDFHEQNLKKLALLAVNANSLQIIDSKLAAKAADAIDEIQDLMIDYCFQNKAMSGGGPVVVGYERRAFQDAVRQKLVGLVAVIREYQVKKIVK